MVSEGGPGHGPIHLLSWSRPGLTLLSNLAGPVQHFKAAILDAWRNMRLLLRQGGFPGWPTS